MTESYWHWMYSKVSRWIKSRGYEDLFMIGLFGGEMIGVMLILLGSLILIDLFLRLVSILSGVLMIFFSSTVAWYKMEQDC